MTERHLSSISNRWRSQLVLECNGDGPAMSQVPRRYCESGHTFDVPALLLSSSPLAHRPQITSMRFHFSAARQALCLCVVAIEDQIFGLEFRPLISPTPKQTRNMPEATAVQITRQPTTGEMLCLWVSGTTSFPEDGPPTLVESANAVCWVESVERKWQPVTGDAEGMS